MHQLIRTLELGLRLAAGICVIMAGLWIFGPNGSGTLGQDDVPGADQLALTAELSDWTQPPAAQVVLDDPDARDETWELSKQLGAQDSGIMPTGYAEAFFGTGVQLWEPTTVDQVSYVGLNALTWVSVGGLWWLLAGITRTSRRQSPFTSTNAQRLSIIGLALLVGGVMHSLASHFLLARMVENSTLANQVSVPGYGFFDLPWACIAVGAAVLALAQVWRRGVIIEDDVKGLV